SWRMPTCRASPMQQRHRERRKTMREPIGVTLVVPAGQEAIRVREVEGGEEVFVTDKPYLASDGRTLVAPIPVVVTEDETYRDSAGVLRETWAVSGLEEEP